MRERDHVETEREVVSKLVSLLRATPNVRLAVMYGSVAAATMAREAISISWSRSLAKRFIRQPCLL